MSSPSEPVVIVLDGHLTEGALRTQLTSAAAQLTRRAAPAPLIVDCSAMTGYDAEARQLFVEWNARHRARVTAVAIVTHKILWHVVIAAMALASGQRMRAADTPQAARRWLASLQA